MSSTPLTTPPTRRALGQDTPYAREKTNDAIGNLNIAVAALQTLVGTTNGNTAAITDIEGLLQSGLNVTIVTAKLTEAGTEGSMTFTDGVLTAQVPAT